MPGIATSDLKAFLIHISDWADLRRSYAHILQSLTSGAGQPLWQLGNDPGILHSGDQDNNQLLGKDWEVRALHHVSPSCSSMHIIMLKGVWGRPWRQAACACAGCQACAGLQDH